MKLSTSVLPFACFAAMMAVVVKALPAPAAPPPPPESAPGPAPLGSTKNQVTYYDADPALPVQSLVNPTTNACNTFGRDINVAKVLNETPKNVRLYSDGQCQERNFVDDLQPGTDWVRGQDGRAVLAYFIHDS